MIEAKQTDAAPAASVVREMLRLVMRGSAELQRMDLAAVQQALRELTENLTASVTAALADGDDDLFG